MFGLKEMRTGMMSPSGSGTESDLTLDELLAIQKWVNCAIARIAENSMRLHRGFEGRHVFPDNPMPVRPKEHRRSRRYVRKPARPEASVRRVRRGHTPNREEPEHDPRLEHDTHPSARACQSH